jgi:hypothetical protein
LRIANIDHVKNTIIVWQTHMLTDIEANYVPYVDERGSRVVRHDKASYGCVESAALWHDHLSQILARVGYERNPYNSCFI